MGRLTMEIFWLMTVINKDVIPIKTTYFMNDKTDETFHALKNMLQQCSSIWKE